MTKLHHHRAVARRGGAAAAWLVLLLVGATAGCLKLKPGSDSVGHDASADGDAGSTPSSDGGDTAAVAGDAADAADAADAGTPPALDGRDGGDADAAPDVTTPPATDSGHGEASVFDADDDTADGGTLPPLSDEGYGRWCHALAPNGYDWYLEWGVEDPCADLLAFRPDLTIDRAGLFSATRGNRVAATCDGTNVNDIAFWWDYGDGDAPLWSVFDKVSQWNMRCTFVIGAMAM